MNAASRPEAARRLDTPEDTQQARRPEAGREVYEPAASLVPLDPGRPKENEPPDLEPGEYGVDESLSAAPTQSETPGRLPRLAGPGEADTAFALPLGEFIAARKGAPPPLIGTADDCLLPSYGLLLLVGKGGKGKTTATIDAAFHLASGVPWLGWRPTRPLRFLIIENEGPREPFRHKLEKHQITWAQPLSGAIYVYADNWGSASLRDRDFVERLNAYVAANEIDVIVGDPLDSLGMEGNGTPDQTREMVDRFKAAGLFGRVAWWVLHHSRKERVEDAIDEAAGAWGGRPDAMLGLEKLEGNRSRLGFNKLRWGRRDGFSYLLGYDPDVEGFELLGEDEAIGERDCPSEIEALLSDGRVRTVEEIRLAAKGGIGADKAVVQKALESNPDRFESFSGEEAKALGRHKNARVWRLASSQKRDQLDRLGGGFAGPRIARLASNSPVRELDERELDQSGRDRLVSTSERDRLDTDLAEQVQRPRSGCSSHPDAPAPGCRYCTAATRSGEVRR